MTESPLARTTVRFADGSARQVDSNLAVDLVGLDADRNLVCKRHGMVYALTPCCNATGKGSHSPTGVVCRGCYRTVDISFGGEARVAIPVLR